MSSIDQRPGGRRSVSRRGRATLGVVALIAVTCTPLTFSAVSAAVPSATLCSGYQACAQGPFSTHGYENAATGSYWRMYAGDNCTNYVAFVESHTYQITAPTYQLGNANQWAGAAAAHGVLVNHTPSVGAVATWAGGSSGMPASGHVAVVEAVGPHDSYVVISQQHVIGADGYDWLRIVRQSVNQWEDWPTSFIHFSSPTLTATVAAQKSEKIVIHVTPPRFAGLTFVLHSRVDRVVHPDLVSRLHDGAYSVTLRNRALRHVFALTVTSSGANVKVLQRGSRVDPSAAPRFEVRRSASKTSVHVVIALRRVGRTRAPATSSSGAASFPLAAL